MKKIPKQAYVLLLFREKKVVGEAFRLVNNKKAPDKIFKSYYSKELVKNSEKP